jgi:hypothetical protein
MADDVEWHEAEGCPTAALPRSRLRGRERLRAAHRGHSRLRGHAAGADRVGRRGGRDRPLHRHPDGHRKGASTSASCTSGTCGMGRSPASSSSRTRQGSSRWCRLTRASVSPVGGADERPAAYNEHSSSAKSGCGAGPVDDRFAFVRGEERPRRDHGLDSPRTAGDESSCNRADAGVSSRLTDGSNTSQLDEGPLVSTVPPGRSLRPGGAGAPGAPPLVVAAPDQSRSPALTDIIGARLMRTAAMISSGSIPWR